MCRTDPQLPQDSILLSIAAAVSTEGRTVQRWLKTFLVVGYIVLLQDWWGYGCYLIDHMHMDVTMPTLPFYFQEARGL